MLVEDQEDRARYHAAFLRRDSTFTGTFFAGVKTTGIFCVPTCGARKPKLENTEYFTELKDALIHGYRPCKLCHPTEAAVQAPETVRRALDLLRSDPRRKLGDGNLRDAGISPDTVRRWFKRSYSMTFQAYQRMVRVNTAMEELKTMKSVTDTAFDSGYESLSGFSYTFKKLTGTVPSNGKDTATLLIERIMTPLGPMFAGATETGVCLLEFTDRRMLETEIGDLQRMLGATVLAGGNAHTRQLALELGEYFAGTRKRFDVRLHTPGSDFQRKAWSALLDIPYGTTVSYRSQAEAIGQPAAVRAVASANGHNRVAIVIPCHRVIGSDGSLTGYAGGLERKRWLLEHEKRFVGAAQDGV
jgi:AraC family transcriptional regulator, regulatory protein of adaptative response / methylated-DNA-[protein]-cysteine methyltransferase